MDEGEKLWLLDALEDLIYFSSNVHMGKTTVECEQY